MRLSCSALSALLAAAILPKMQASAGDWEIISDRILSELAATHPKSGDPFAQLTAGISVDRRNGDVYMLANNIGICKSTDQGRTFTLVSGDKVSGRFETGWGLNIDPNGRRLMCFAIYGASGYSPDGGKTWSASTTSHLDYGAVDWADTGKALLAIGHESGGKLMYSPDAGSQWKTLGAGYWAVGMFDHQTLLASLAKQPGIMRSSDGGITWSKVSDEALAAPVMVQFKGVGYWLGERGLLTSRDKGLTWTLVGPTPKGATLGPMFGRNERDMVVGSPDGLFESKDGGKTWSMAAPLAPEIKVLQGGLYGTYGWDPIHNIFYASQMSKPAYRLSLR